MFRSRLALLALLLSPFASISPAEAHGSHGGGGESLEAGDFDFTPIITIEGHGGFDTNLEGDPKHYAIDGMFGGVFEWGLANGGSFAIEAAIGPALCRVQPQQWLPIMQVRSLSFSRTVLGDPLARIWPSITTTWS